MSPPAAREQPILVVADVEAWRRWLVANEEVSDGVWLTLAKKGATAPTTLTYADALEEALCSGWIDGQARSVDAATYRQRFTPRRARSTWSMRNVELIGRLVEEGRVRLRGLAEIERARADGRWERAYPGPATAEVPAEMAIALADAPDAGLAFSALSRSERYQVLHPILTASTDELRSRRIAAAVARLAGAPRDDSGG